MPRIVLVSASALAAVAWVAASFPTAAKPAETPLLQFEERLSQTLVFSRRGPDRGVALVESRRLVARTRLPLNSPTPPPLTADDRIGVRIGDWAFERRLADDPHWRPSRARFRLRARTAGPVGREDVLLRAEWRRGSFLLRVTARGVAPVAAAQRDAVAGILAPSVDAAARLGADGWRLAGVAEGSLVRRDAVLLGDTVSLVRIAVEGEVPTHATNDDSDVPSVAIETPESGALLTDGAVSVSGALRDHQTLAEVLVSVNGGPPTPVPFAPDPESGFLTDRTATFSASVDPVPGRNTVTVTARDAAGNESSSSVDFAVVVPRNVPVAAGLNFAIASDAAGGGRLWGGTESLYPTPGTTSSEPYSLAGLDGAVSFAAGYYHALALFPDGTVRSWGAGSGGQLGHGTASAEPVRVPAEIDGLAGIVSVAAAAQNSVALRADGTVLVWGWNEDGELGNGTKDTLQLTPLAVAGLPPIRSIAIGVGSRGCTVFAVDEDGDLWGWGDDEFGQLARGAVTPRNSLVPVRIEGVSGVASVAAGWGFVVAVTEDGRAVGWGRNSSGQIPAVGYVGAYSTPHELPGAQGIVAVACGVDSTFLLRDDGVVLACGNNDSGQLGNGTTVSAKHPQPEPLPAAIPGLTGVTHIAAGAFTAHAVRDDGSLWCWGSNASGQVGDGTTETRTSPVLVLLD